jgi:hypothetical protein
LFVYRIAFFAQDFAVAGESTAAGTSAAQVSAVT